jgi:rhodanese-related sulfurtransferase
MKVFKQMRLLAVILTSITLSACFSLNAGQKSSLSGGHDYSDPSQLFVLVSKHLEPYVLVDVRTPDEYRAGHIPSAINIPYDRIAANPPTGDTSALVILYCASGGRSSKATASLKDLGYTHVVNFGSIRKWTWHLHQSDDPGDCPCE